MGPSHLPTRQCTHCGVKPEGSDILATIRKSLEATLNNSDVHGTAYDVLANEGLRDTVVSVDNEDFRLAHVAGAGKKGVVWKATNGVALPRAIKFVSPSEYQDRVVQSERVRAAPLEQYEEFARFERAATVQLPSDVTVIAIVSEWVEGTTLEKLVNDPAHRITAEFVLAFVEAMAQVLNALQVHELRHDDLNLGNVMVVEPAPGALDEELKFKVIDLGSLKPAADHDSAKKGGIDDHRWVALHLCALINAGRRRTDLEPRERQFFNELRSVMAALLEDDPTRRLTNARLIRQQVWDCWLRTERRRTERQLTPFEFISAEQIADDRVLLDLFTDSLPWLDRLNSSAPHVLTGPRGCGKSTVFRWLALKTHLHGVGSEESVPRISGFYVSVTVELQSRYSWIQTDAMAAEVREEITHLFVLVLIREVVRTFALVDEASTDRFGLRLGATASEEIRNFISDRVAFETTPVFSGISLPRQLSRHIDKLVWESHERLVRPKQPVHPYCNASTLFDFTSLMTRLVSRFQSHPLVFLIDDFSGHRVPAPVQEVLHEVIWGVRNGSHFMKVSTEKNGLQVSQATGLTAERTREFTEIDCGYEMLNSPHQLVHRFAEQLLDRRLAACNYEGRARQILGSSEWTSGDGHTGLGWFLRDQAGKKGARAAAFFGVDYVAELCSGDVAALLRIFEEVFTAGHVTQNSTSEVSRHIQHNAITRVSRQLRQQVRDYHSVGRQLYAFTEAFGEFIVRVLREAEPGKDGPVLIPRIEVDNYAKTRDEIDANSSARLIYDELLRRAILIDMAPGAARHDFSTSLRLHFRPIFLPGFRAALRKSEALKLNSNQFLHALTDPAEAFESFRRNRVHKTADTSADNTMF